MVASTTPTETTMKLTDTKQHLSEVVNRVARGEAHIVVEKSGLPVVAIISMDEYRRFKAEEAASAARRAELGKLMTEISKAFADVPVDELERQVDRALQKVRAEMRAERQAAKCR